MVAMNAREKPRWLPTLERLEAKRLLSGDGAAASARESLDPAAQRQAEIRAERHAAAEARAATRQTHRQAGESTSTLAHKPLHGFLLYRITNPNIHNNHFSGTFGQVLVQKAQPVAGQKYNILFVTIRNGTAQTFDAGSNFQVKFPGQREPTQILKGDDLWKPGQWYTFYVLTKKYYALPNPVSSGFQFNLDGAFSVAIPGPSGIFNGITYDPATFPRTLNRIVEFGNGNQGGKGIKFGLPNTSINEFVSAKTRRSDFGGYF
jgi:hypothetical protein